MHSFEQRIFFLHRQEVGVNQVSNKFLAESKDNIEIPIYDTDIISSYCEPWDNGPATYGRRGTGQVVPLTPDIEKSELEIIDHRSEKLSQFLSEYLLSEEFRTRINQFSPIYQSPWHYDETQRSYEGLRNLFQGRYKFDSASTIGRANRRFQQQVALINHFKSSDVETPLAEDLLFQLVRTKLDKRTIGFPSKLSGLDRFDEMKILGAAPNPLTAESINLTSNFKNKATLIEVLQQVENSINYEGTEFNDLWVIKSSFNLLTSHFDKLLNGHQRRYFKKETKLIDAHTFAWVYLVNSLLLRGGIQNIRLTLITASVRDIEKTYNYNRGLNELARRVVHLMPIENSSKMEFQKVFRSIFNPECSSKNSPYSYFSLNFHRHFWGYLGQAIRAINNSDNSKNSENSKPLDDQNDVYKYDVFRGAFVKVSGQETWEGYKALERLSMRNKSGANEEKIHYEAPVRHLNDLIDDTLAKYALAEDARVDEIKEAVFKVIKKSMGSDQPVNWEKLEANIDEVVSISKERALVSLSSVGAEYLRRVELIGKQNPPDLHFETLTNTSAIFRKLCLFDGYKSGAEFLKDFDRIIEDTWGAQDYKNQQGFTPDDRQEIHLKFVVLAAAFASANSWNLARTNALRAVEIIERADRIGSPIKVKSNHKNYYGPCALMTGREAYLLAAISHRVMAKSVEDVTISETFLKLAERAHTFDVENNPDLTVTKVRYVSERLAGALSRFYHLTQNKISEDKYLELLQKLEKSKNNAWEFILNSDKEIHFNKYFENGFSYLSVETREQDTASFIRGLCALNSSDVTASKVLVNLIQVNYLIFSTSVSAKKRADAKKMIEFANATLDVIYDTKQITAGLIQSRLTRCYRLLGKGLTSELTSDERSKLDNLLDQGVVEPLRKYDKSRYQRIRDYLMS